jgi:hypothetical protein
VAGAVVVGDVVVVLGAVVVGDAVADDVELVGAVLVVAVVSAAEALPVHAISATRAVVATRTHRVVSLRALTPAPRCHGRRLPRFSSRS